MKTMKAKNFCARVSEQAYRLEVFMSAKIKTAPHAGVDGVEAESGTHLYRAYLITKVALVDRAQLSAKQQESLNVHKELGVGPLYLVTGVSVAVGKALNQQTFFVNKDHMDSSRGLLPSNIVFDIKVLGKASAVSGLCVQSLEVAGHLSLQQWVETLKKAHRSSAPKRASPTCVPTL